MFVRSGPEVAENREAETALKVIYLQKVSTPLIGRRAAGRLHHRLEERNVKCGAYLKRCWQSRADDGVWAHVSRSQFSAVCLQGVGPEMRARPVDPLCSGAGVRSGRQRRPRENGYTGLLAGEQRRLKTITSHHHITMKGDIPVAKPTREM